MISGQSQVLIIDFMVLLVYLKSIFFDVRSILVDFISIMIVLMSLRVDFTLLFVDFRSILVYFLLDFRSIRFVFRQFQVISCYYLSISGEFIFNCMPIPGDFFLVFKSFTVDIQ